MTPQIPPCPSRIELTRIMLAEWGRLATKTPDLPSATFGYNNNQGAKPMSGILKLTAMPSANANEVAREIRFTLSVEGAEPLICSARYGVAAQISSGLGAVLRILRLELSKQGALEQVASEQIREAHIQKNQLSGQVLVHLTTVLGVPYIFQFPPQAALRLANWLKNEAEKETPMGSA